MMLDNPEEFKTLQNTVTEILKEDGQDNYVELLTNAQISIEQTGYDNWNGGTYYYTVYIVVDVKAFVNYKEYIDSIESEIREFFVMAFSFPRLIIEVHHHPILTVLFQILKEKEKLI